MHILEHSSAVALNSASGYRTNGLSG